MFRVGVFCLCLGSALFGEPLRETSQKELPTCFSCFEHLYFNASSRTFFALGASADVNKAINVKDKRGYTCKKRGLLKPLIKKEVSPVLGTSVVLFERDGTPNHFTHLFHFLEHLLGIWNFGGEKERDEVKLFLLAGNGKKIPKDWKGSNEATFHLIKALFPHAEIKTWDSFLKETKGQVICFEKVITSDRSMEVFKKEPYFTDRMLGGYFQALSKESMDHLVLCLRKYCQWEKKSSDKTVVTYVKRSSRSLAPHIEKELLDKIGNLSHVDLHVVDFASMSFEQQIKTVANTDVLLGVHGNGLSHALFMSPGSTLIELFPKKSFRAEYKILASLRGLKYFGWIDEEGFVEDEKAYYYGDVFVPTLNTNVDAILDVLEHIR